MNGSTVIVPPAQGTFGNMVRDALRDKAFHNIDMSVSKTWTFRERYSAQFKAEFFNILNRTGYAPPSVSLASPSTFGQSTNTNDSGNAQCTAKTGDDSTHSRHLHLRRGVAHQIDRSIP